MREILKFPYGTEECNVFPSSHFTDYNGVILGFQSCMWILSRIFSINITCKCRRRLQTCINPRKSYLFEASLTGNYKQENRSTNQNSHLSQNFSPPTNTLNPDFKIVYGFTITPVTTYSSNRKEFTFTLWFLPFHVVEYHIHIRYY